MTECNDFFGRSIVIPVYNDPTGISKTINSLLGSFQSPPEILVVDNGSTDDTRDVIRNYANEHPNVHLLGEDEIQGSYAARNKGAQHAEGDVLAFIDADETVDDDWLETALQAMNEQNVDYLGCNVELTLPEDTLVGRYNARTGFPVKQYLENEHYAPTCALLVRREVFEDVGTFDSRLISGGDREFGERVYEAGYEQGYAEDATVYHPARTSLNALASKNFRVGRGFCQKQRYYPERFGKPGIPPTPSGDGDDDEDEPDSGLTRAAFALLSIAMLACRGFGYYYEYAFGEKRDDVPAPTR
ncbi:glycosyltransferase [Halolamina salifodinae]|uniref:Glycosyltransferase involved in cell wall biosynthesis n=1 Tax=Halolamina salifodinae TaxID=1202767 RepID=A0A8T4GV84_9EURY|nr:glycosyltransferase [Halolamina salifodinae]MBP1985604.1 glycosyltransferase involved in cell wall biosynthesis [Halolamina salifodinae]